MVCYIWSDGHFGNIHEVVQQVGGKSRHVFVILGENRFIKAKEALDEHFKSDYY